MDTLSRKMINLMKKSTTKIVDTDKKPTATIERIYARIVGILLEMNRCKGVFKEEVELREFVYKNVWVGGGCLSEQFITGYNKNQKDIDIFIHTAVADLATEKSSIELDTEQEHQEFLDILNNRGRFKAISQTERIQTYNNEEIVQWVSTVITGAFDNEPGVNVDLIIGERDDLRFDIGIREFYYNGSTILASEKALNDIRDKIITVRTMNSPYATLYRVNEFANRYGYKIDTHSYDLLMNCIAMRLRFEYDPKSYVKEKLKQVKKYKTAELQESLAKELLDLLDRSLIHPHYELLDRFVRYTGLDKSIRFEQMVEKLRYLDKKDLKTKMVIDTKKIEYPDLVITDEETKKKLTAEERVDFWRELEKEIEIIENGDPEEKIRSIFDREFDIQEHRQFKLNDLRKRVLYNYSIKTHDYTLEYIRLRLNIEMCKKGLIKNIPDKRYAGDSMTIKEKIQANRFGITPEIDVWMWGGMDTTDQKYYKLAIQGGPQKISVSTYTYEKNDKRSITLYEEEYFFLEGERFGKIAERLRKLEEVIVRNQKDPYKIEKVLQAPIESRQQEGQLTEQEKKHIKEIQQKVIGVKSIFGATGEELPF